MNNKHDRGKGELPPRSLVLSMELDLVVWSLTAVVDKILHQMKLVKTTTIRKECTKRRKRIREGLSMLARDIQATSQKKCLDASTSWEPTKQAWDEQPRRTTENYEKK